MLQTEGRLTKEKVRNRIIRTAAELWGFKDTEIEDFDPLVGMLIGSLAVEVDKINDEILSSQERALKRLAQLLTPDVLTGAKPAHGVVHARPVEPVCVIEPDLQVYANKKLRTDSPKELSKDFFFSPAGYFRLFDGDIVFAVCGSHLYEVDKDFSKNPIGEAERSLPENILWLGIDLNDSIRTLDKVSFLFDWKNDPEEQTYIQHLPHAKWYVGNKEIHSRVGFIREHETDEGRRLINEFDITQKVEDQVQRLFRHHFITLEDAAENGSDLRRCPFPDDFKEYFSEQTLGRIKGDLVWIRVEFPTSMPLRAIAESVCLMNCFPVVNRQLETFAFRLQPNLNIVPLNTNALFFAVKSVTKTDGTEYLSVPLASIDQNVPQTYTLRHGGVGRFDSRNAREMLSYLLGLLRDESAAFTSLDRDFLTSHIKELNQIIARMEQNLRQNLVTLKDSTPYLLVRPDKDGENVYVQFWSTNGPLANEIPSGKKLDLYTGADLKKETIFFVIRTGGGRDKLNQEDSLLAYKQAIMTRGRVVTSEDIKAVCFAELGKNLKEVQVTRGIMIDSSPKAGFVRTIDIILTPSAGKDQSREEWEDICHYLKELIESLSSETSPLRVMMKER